jgi:hypothetical protein
MLDKAPSNAPVGQPAIPSIQPKGQTVLYETVCHILIDHEDEAKSLSHEQYRKALLKMKLL